MPKYSCKNSLDTLFWKSQVLLAQYLHELSVIDTPPLVERVDDEITDLEYYLVSARGRGSA
jgi:hypothetical protein